MLELILPDAERLGSEDPPIGELLCPLETLVPERTTSDSFPTATPSRLLETAARLSDPLDLPKNVELDNCKIGLGMQLRYR